MYVLFDKNLKIKVLSNCEASSEDLKCRISDKEYDWSNLIGKRIPASMILPEDLNKKENKDLRIAMICNWGDKCGISTYSYFLASAIFNKVNSIKIFSEISEESLDMPLNVEVDKCWERGENLLELAYKIKEWEPDFVLIQHEYGIFPNAFRFMQLMQELSGIPTAVCMHSVYKHLDKAVYTEMIPNIIVHTDQGKNCLRELGNTSNIFVIPHGCLKNNTKELWNIMGSPYTVMQFGFGFKYKGVDQALMAVSHLIHNDPKFKNLYYYYLCSTNSHSETECQQYVNELMALANKLNIRNNIAIVLKYQTEQMLNLYLRLSKIIIFPYVINGDNQVFAASGAARIAMSSGKPVICSSSNLFDDLEGIVPRPNNYIELAKEIDEIFSNNAYRNSIIEKSQKYIEEHSWDFCAEKYLSLYNEIISKKFV